MSERIEATARFMREPFVQSPQHTFNTLDHARLIARFSAALSLLFAIGAINVENDILVRSR